MNISGLLVVSTGDTAVASITLVGQYTSSDLVKSAGCGAL